MQFFHSNGLTTLLVSPGPLPLIYQSGSGEATSVVVILGVLARQHEQQKQLLWSREVDENIQHFAL